MRAHLLVGSLVIAFLASVSLLAAQQKSESPKPETMALASNVASNTRTDSATNSKAVTSAKSTDALAKTSATVKNEPMYDRIEGEKRFRANCGRCHQAPHKFPPREAATIVRHMRVRATITDEDMRLILKYMTQ
jgi:mono/diheme cytochrome c family protein